MEDPQNLIAALDPCRSDVAALSAGDVGAPAFGEPWHAQVFGLAMTLSQAGVFSWADWVATFSAEIRRNPQTADETVEGSYYRQWSEALITLLGQTGHLDADELATTAEAWRRSYLATEHGLPVIFRRDLPPMRRDVHHHDHHPTDVATKVRPISVTPAIG